MSSWQGCDCFLEKGGGKVFWRVELVGNMGGIGASKGRKNGAGCLLLAVWSVGFGSFLRYTLPSLSTHYSAPLEFLFHVLHKNPFLFSDLGIEELK